MNIQEIINCNIFHEDKEEELHELLHACVDEVCTGKGPMFNKFSSIDWTKDTFNAVHNFILTLLQKRSCLYAEEEKMPLEFQEFPEHVKKAILTCLKIRRAQLTDALLLKYSSKHLPTLFDFDWRLKYVMGSSKMSTIKEPLLQLDFFLQEKQEEKTMEIEFNKDELEVLINKIESIVT